MRKFLVFVLTTFIVSTSIAKEGMWVPIFLKGAIMDDMKLHGFKLSADDIYSVNKSSLKDAVVRFGGGCTGEIISSNGLLLTNHHCGYSRIQSHSSVENDYLTDGYWASNMGEELPNPGLVATFIVRIEDVSVKVNEGINDEMETAERDEKFKANVDQIVAEATKDSHYEGFVKPFFNGNQHILFITETFKDVRLVGAPPSSIGKYGFDTDNWVWPRHTGDFSLFRVYAGKDNKPAEYSEENVPYQSKHHFPISLAGYDEGDFTMVYGFPARTSEYLTSEAVDFIMNKSNPTKIEIRTKKLEVLNRKMAESDEVRIKYAAKQSSTSNAWKKWKGQNKGLTRNDAIQRKKFIEEKLSQKMELYPDSFAPYLNLLENLQEKYKEINEVALARDYYVEIAYYGTDAMKLGYRMRTYVDKNAGEGLNDEDIDRLKKSLSGHFKNYDYETDLAVFKAILPLYINSEENFYKPEVLKNLQSNKDLNKWLQDIYESSILTDQSALNTAIEKDASKALIKVSKDELYVFIKDLYEFYKNQIGPAYTSLNTELNNLNKLYIQALQLAFPDRSYYPDANATLRVAYGRVEGMSPGDAITYKYYTTLDGVIAKYIPDSYEYDLPEKLVELYENKDYGQYAKNGEMRVCFIASNHTSGGNSGSPVINDKGQLIGLNFDRNWEGTMSDINYDINQCRNISVDIRYVLFIIDKFAGAEWLIKEMTIIPVEIKAERIDTDDIEDVEIME